MKREIIEFKNIVTDLYAISESPNFSDEMRNKASELQYYINKKVGNLEPIIRKSCQTWVARYDGVDYLYTKDDRKEPYFLTTSTKVVRCEWKSFSGANPDIKEFSDELAKLRPVVVYRNRNDKLIPNKDHLETLYGCCEDQIITDSCKEHYRFFRLATVEDFPELDDSFIMCPKCYCANNPARVTCSDCGGKLFHE